MVQRKLPRFTYNSVHYGNVMTAVLFKFLASSIKNAIWYVVNKLIF